jgi:hypothetical protein
MSGGGDGVQIQYQGGYDGLFSRGRANGMLLPAPPGGHWDGQGSAAAVALAYKFRAGAAWASRGAHSSMVPIVRSCTVRRTR